MGRQAPRCRFDVRDVEQAQEADSEVPQAGEGPGRVPLAGPATILVIGHVTHVVQAVLDAPMAPVLGQQLCGARFSAALAANQIDPLEGRLVMGWSPPP